MPAWWNGVGAALTDSVGMSSNPIELSQSVRTNWKLPENEGRLIAAVADNVTIAAILRELNLKPRGGNFSTIRNHIVRLSLNTDHHVGQSWNKDNYKVPVYSSTSGSFKAYLIREHGHRCWSCSLSEWMGLPIPLELDHIDGNHSNNEWDNLRILCCNCHAQTPTFRNRKRLSPAGEMAAARDSSPRSRKRVSVQVRGGVLRPSKIDWPSISELESLIKSKGFSGAAKELKVSDNSIRKHLKKNNVDFSLWTPFNNGRAKSGASGFAGSTPVAGT